MKFIFRISYFSATLLLCTLFYIKHHIHGLDLIFTCLVIGLCFSIVIAHEWWFDQKQSEAVLSILFGISMGCGLAFLLENTLHSISVLSPILEGLPWQLPIYCLFTYLSIVFLLQASAQSTNCAQINLRTCPHHPLITLLRISTYGFILLLLIYSFLEVKSLSIESNILGLPAKDMAQLDYQGYDFNVTHRQGGQIKFLGLAFVTVCIFILEWFFRKSSTRLFFVLIPWLLSVTCLLSLSQKLLNFITLPSWIPIDLVQVFTILSVFYFTTILSWHAFSLKVLHYPFIQITFSHED